MKVQTINFDNSGMFRSKLKDNFSVSEHIHQCSEVVLVLDGQIVACVDGEERTLSRGECAMISPFRIHSFKSIGETKIWLCVFSNYLLSNFLSKDDIYKGRSSPFFTANEKTLSMIKDNLPDTDEIMIGYDYAKRRELQLVLFPLANDYICSVQKQVNDSSTSVLPKILLYLDEHFSENIEASDLARALGYTPRHISRLLADLKGYSFPALLNSFRIEHAKEMIRNSDRKIIDISTECGYTCERTFYRAFLRFEGMTPSEYRAMIKLGGKEDTKIRISEAQKSDK